MGRDAVFIMTDEARSQIQIYTLPRCQVKWIGMKEKNRMMYIKSMDLGCSESIRMALPFAL